MTELALAIPFYSGVGYLRRALQSLREQSTDRWRAIVVDDAGPEPNAADVVHDLRDPRVRYVRNDTNLGLAGNWNAALELAGGDFVTLFHRMTSSRATTWRPCSRPIATIQEPSPCTPAHR